MKPMAVCLPVRSSRLLLALAALALALASPALHAKDKSGDDDILKDVEDIIKNSGGGGSYKLVLVGPDGKPVADKLFIRGIPGQYAISAFPRVFILEGEDLFTAGPRPNAKVGAQAPAVSVICPPDPDAGDAVHYKPECSANIQAGKYAITPFGLEFEVGATLKALHPALSVEGATLRIHTIPVTFATVDKAKGALAPLRGLKLTVGSADLLANLVDAKDAPKEPAAFCPLTLWLPRGCEYGMGSTTFKIDAEGRIVPGPGCNFKDGRFVVDAASAAPEAEAVGKGYWGFTYNLRRVFKRGEVARLAIVASGQYPKGPVELVLRAGKDETPVGRLEMPAVAGVDSRLFLLDTGRLAPGKYTVGVRGADSHDFAFEIVEIVPSSPFVIMAMDACGGGGFKPEPESFARMAQLGSDYWISFGEASQVGALKPDPAGAAPADAPAALRQPAWNAAARRMLDESLRAGVLCIDYENRRAGFYNEGLALNHSYGPSVDRMIRHVQIFAQETEDFPAFAGMDYCWFPCLGGYSEGGVPCNGWWGLQMQALHDKVKAQGFTALTEAERQKLYGKDSKATPEELRALTRRQRAFWRAEQRGGFYDAFKLWTDKLKQVRPDLLSMATDNTGHDNGKGMADAAEALDGLAFCCYTDFGDWPDSAGFVTDWIHSVAGSKPFWHDIDPANSSYAMFAKALYDFSRGAEGVGIALGGARNVKVRSRFSHFFKEYGPLAAECARQSDMAILHNEAQFQLYDVHALHSHLMRLGYGPIILGERAAEKSGVPAFVKVVAIPNLRLPLSDGTEKALRDFQARGGKVIQIGEKPWKIDGAAVVAAPLKTLWDVGGFANHKEFWAEFHAVRPALEKAMAEAGVAPPNGAAPEKALIVPMLSGGLRYVAVIADVADTKNNMEAAPVRDVAVKVGAARKVVNLVTGDTVPVKDGQVTLDLVAEPAALLAILDRPPAGVKLLYPAAAKAGQSVELAADVTGLAEKTHAPVEIVLADPAGNVKARFYRMGTPAQAVQYRLAENDPPGEYTATATELLTGLSAKAKIKVEAAGAMQAVAPLPEVYVPHPDRLQRFLKRAGEVRILVEETQGDLAPLADQVASALAKAGRPARVQKVGPESYDTWNQRWFWTKADDAVMDRIRAGEIVGYRGQLAPFIVKATRAFDPQRGGWSDIAPMYIVRHDVVLFSGGRLADSLKAVTDWIDRPNLPGKGGAFVEVVLSPFWANCDAVALVANDADGRRAAVAGLLDALAKSAPLAAPAPFPAPTVAKAAQEASGTTAVALAKPAKGLVPPALAKGLRVSNDGCVAAQVADRTVLLGPKNEALGTAPADPVNPSILPGGRYVWGNLAVVTRHAAWHFPTSWHVDLMTLDPQAKTCLRIPAVEDTYRDLVPGWQSVLAVSPDGTRAFVGRTGGGAILYDIANKSYLKVPCDASAVRFYESVREPVNPTGSAFSGDGRFLAYSVGCFPTGYGGMGWAPRNPYAAGLTLLDAKTGQVVWQRWGKDQADSAVAGYPDCLAVADGGRRVVLMDFYHEAVILDEKGADLYRKPLFDWKARWQWQFNPLPKRAALSRDGSTCLFWSAETVLLTDDRGSKETMLELPGVCDLALAPDGSRVYVMDLDGLVTCLDRQGAKKWAVQTAGTSGCVGATAAGAVAFDGSGAVHRIDAAGKAERVALDLGAPVAELKSTDLPLAGPGAYQPPPTLAILQKKAGAKEIARWEPQGQPTELCGLKFYAVQAPISIKAPAAGPCLVHMVYRQAKPTEVTVASGPRAYPFVLDLATPEYRVVDLPIESKGDEVTVAVKPGEGLALAELSVHAFTWPGVNGAYIQSAGTERTVDALGAEKDPGKADVAEILDDKNPTEAARAHRGKMKNATIYSVNTDVDKIAGAYFRQTGNVLESFDGLRFNESRPAPWTRWLAFGTYASSMGSKIVLPMGYTSRPKLCATYERTLKQSEVMRGIAICGGTRGDLADVEALAREPRMIAGASANDQFFNVFDVEGAKFDVLGVFVFGPERDHGLSEIELYE